MHHVEERRITRWEHEAVTDAMQDRLDRAPKSMLVRCAAVEHPFGTLKACMGAANVITRVHPDIVKNEGNPDATHADWAREHLDRDGLEKCRALRATFKITEDLRATGGGKISITRENYAGAGFGQGSGYDAAHRYRHSMWSLEY